MGVVSRSTIYWFFAMLAIIVSAFILVPKFNRSEDFSSLVLESTSTSNVFYIAWDGGAIGRRCPKFDCEISHSFQEREPLELPYSSIEDMPEWIDFSSVYKKDCFVHKSVFSTNPDTVLITPSWKNRIARIVCDSGSGSGLLTWSEGKEAIVTAKHVVENAEVCEIHLPKKGYKKLDKISFRLHEEYDLAILLLGDFKNEHEEDVKTLAKKPVSICQPGTQGEEIFVFGYPDAVSKFSNNFTITDGIIANVTKNHYFTAATIGPGNSGGVVIKKKENCYLGIPVNISRGEKVIPGEDVQYIENWGIILRATLLDYDEIKGFSF